MVKFNEKGQGYFDFLLENTSTEFVAAVEENIVRWEKWDKENPGTVLGDGVEVHVSELDSYISVYVKHTGSIAIFTYGKRYKDFTRTQISTYDLKMMKGMFPDV